jgi:heme/copper-type cytochrome/quinol oxidase subunit 2
MKKVILFILVFISQFISAQCAMCKAVVENGDAEIAEGINNGITYLMIFPYLLIGVLFFTLYRYRKKAKN